MAMKREIIIAGAGLSDLPAGIRVIGSRNHGRVAARLLMVPGLPTAEASS
jgi:hypothetical protein